MILWFAFIVASIYCSHRIRQRQKRLRIARERQAMWSALQARAKRQRLEEAKRNADLYPNEKWLYRLERK